MKPAFDLLALRESNRQFAARRHADDQAAADPSLVFTITKDKNRFMQPAYVAPTGCGIPKEFCNLCLACAPASVAAKVAPLPIPESRFSAGFKVRQYSSGEMTGGQFTTGHQTKIIPPSRCGALETTGFTQSGRNKIRRAVENAGVDLNYFLTLTFSPSLLKPWHLDQNGKVRHDYAKHKLKNFRDALTKQCKRRYNDKFLFVWVAELQKNGNIHFHMLMNRRFPIHPYYIKKDDASRTKHYFPKVKGKTPFNLTDLWNQGENAVDVKYINDSNHAVNYMRKYLTKDEESVIQGNRYNISTELRERMKPTETNIVLLHDDEIAEFGTGSTMAIIKAFRDDIESRGGTVLEFGVSIPAPRRSREFVDKKGKKRQSKGVQKKLAGDVLRLITGGYEDTPF